MSPNAPFTNVSPPPGRKERFLLELLTADTVEDACDRAGIDRKTGYRWRRDPRFKARLDRLRQQAFDHGVARVQGLCGKAVAALDRALTCGRTASEIAAAAKVLDLATKYLELHDLVRRLEAVEAIHASTARPAGSRLAGYLE